MSDAEVKTDKMKPHHPRPINCILKVVNIVYCYLMCLACALKGERKNATHSVGI